MKRQEEGIMRAPNGFSLIECLVSLALVIFLVTGTAELIILSLRAKQTADWNMRAAGYIGAKLECLKSVPFDAEEMQAGTYSETFREPGEGPAFRRTWTIGDPFDNMKRVEVEVSQEGIPDRVACLVLYISKDIGFLP
jgi:prepilin-type N-terminal cleavage/methylation domain-containing protein